ncbi:LLM class flavin-dependent oxidoreductase [Tanticharoenia sakaeratensis]|nr:LLM class flavin-dependent oxidoreductase [Tanticharoenia sakaeratensis]GBQ24221.1 monooxygenase-like protein [Tanticharoenia sakaeratensis NBRC 103193]
MNRKMHLGLFVLNTGHHVSAWRDPDTAVEPATTLRSLTHTARVAERGLFDTVFFAESAGLPDLDFETMSKSGRGVFIEEPLTSAAAVAAVTSRIGIVVTQNTTYDHPYHVARRVLSLDHLSGGRVGCNLVTGVSDVEARNFGFDGIPDHAWRYRKAEEFCDVVMRLWRSWPEGSVRPDKATGRLFDPDKACALDHRGEFFKVMGPMNLPPSPQGAPVLVQAGGSPAGRALAARYAEMIYTVQNDLDAACAFYRDVKARVTGFGRDPASLKVMPGLSPVIGRTRAEAQERDVQLKALTDPALGLGFLQNWIGNDVDLASFDLDQPLPQTLQTRFGTASLQVLLEASRTMTLRELAQYAAGGRGHLRVVGTAVDVADEMEARFRAGAADGFNIMPATIPGGIEDFVDQVVPLLQARGLFRTAYEGSTLRGHLVD